MFRQVGRRRAAEFSGSTPPNYDDHAPPNYGPPHLAGQRAHRVESIGGLCFHAQHKPPRLHDLNGRRKCQVALFIIVIIIIIIVIVIGVACSCNLAWMGHRRQVSRIHCACSFIHSFRGALSPNPQRSTLTSAPAHLKNATENIVPAPLSLSLLLVLLAC